MPNNFSRTTECPTKPISNKLSNSAIHTIITRGWKSCIFAYHVCIYFKDIARGTITVMERLDKFSKEHNLPNYQRLKEINDIPSTRLQKVVDTGETYYVRSVIRLPAYNTHHIKSLNLKLIVFIRFNLMKTMHNIVFIPSWKQLRVKLTPSNLRLYSNKEFEGVK